MTTTLQQDYAPIQTGNFEDCATEDAVKQRFQALLYQHHPDAPENANLGEEERTQKEKLIEQIAAEYKAALQHFDGRTFPAQIQQKKGKKTVTKEYDRTYNYDEEVEKQIVEKIQALFALKMPNVDILLVGTWVWVQAAEGYEKQKPTKAYREQLKELGFQWNNKRTAWQWHHEGESRPHWRRATNSDIFQKYGASRLSPKDDE